MEGLLSLIWGLLGGVIAWFATMIVGQPFYSLLNLRWETAKILQLYEPAISDDRAMSAQWIAEREASYRSCAAQLLAFAASQSVIMCIVAQLLKWHPRRAAEQLRMLAPLGPGAAERRNLRAAVAEALKLKL